MNDTPHALTRAGSTNWAGNDCALSDTSGTTANDVGVVADVAHTSSMAAIVALSDSVEAPMREEEREKRRPSIGRPSLKKTRQ